MLSGAPPPSHDLLSECCWFYELTSLDFCRNFVRRMSRHALVEEIGFPRGREGEREGERKRERERRRERGGRRISKIVILILSLLISEQVATDVSLGLVIMIKHSQTENLLKIDKQ